MKEGGVVKLTIKQKAFADYYIQLGNATEAAIRAGYSKKYTHTNANKLLQNTTIKKYLNERLKELDNEKIAAQQEVLQYLTSVMRGQSESEVIAVESIGGGMSKANKILKHPDEKERLKAAEMLGKIHCMFTDKMQINSKEPIVFVEDVKE
jgi:phage terminase small subunit